MQDMMIKWQQQGSSFNLNDWLAQWQAQGGNSADFHTMINSFKTQAGNAGNGKWSWQLSVQGT